MGKLFGPIKRARKPFGILEGADKPFGILKGSSKSSGGRKRREESEPIFTDTPTRERTMLG
jgi:hypothetical protein